MPIKQRITPFLWFDGQAEEAAQVLCLDLSQFQGPLDLRYGEGGPAQRYRHDRWL